MTIRVTGRKVFGRSLKAAAHGTILCILVLSVVSKAKAEGTSPASDTLPTRTLNEIVASSENGLVTVTLKMNRLLEPQVLVVENPPRLVLDFPDTVNRVSFKKLPLSTDPVQAVRVSQFQSANPAIARVVFDLGKGFGSHRISLSGSAVQVTFFPAGRTDDSPASSSIIKSEKRQNAAEKPIPDGRNTPSVRTEALPVERGLSNGILSGIEASYESGSLTVTLEMTRSLQPTVLTLENPPRLVLDFPDTVSKVALKKLPLNTGPVRAVRVSQYRTEGPAIARVVFDLGESFGLHRISLDASHVRVVFPASRTAAGNTGPSPKATPESTDRASEVSTPAKDGDLRAESATRTTPGDSGQTSQPVQTKTETATRPAAVARRAASPGPAVPYASSPREEPDAVSKTEDKPSDPVVRASSEKPRQAPGIDTSRPAVASQASKSPVRLSLEKTLDRVGQSVEQFRKNFKSIACTESVSQTKLGKRETVIYRKDQEFEYMIFTDIMSDGMNVEESRVEKKTKGRTKDLPLLVTKGFPTLLLIFHPFYQGSFKYKWIGEETVEGQDLVRIDFKQIKGRRSTSILNLKDKNYPLELEGTAWIDSESYNIQRIRAGLIKPMESVGLEAFNSDVRYVPMNFTPDSSTYWMPETATVEVMTKRQHWRNVHQFEDYRLFSISSESEISIP